jgi:putative heme-binding domain-containing protein
VNGGPTFGPPAWRGDAFVAGYSRGKLFRTQLVKTAAGYVAHNQLLAALNMMPADACVSPRGDLIVAVHSGKPDWGSGPTGGGKLYRISYVGRESAQPVAVWPSSATEMQIEFDRVLDSVQAKQWAREISIAQGKYVSAGDPFETLRPGYQTVQNQLFEQRYSLKVLSTALSSNGRTLTLRTEPAHEAMNYAVSFPHAQRLPAGNESSGARVPAAAQFPGVELACDLTGVEAEWHNSNGTEAFKTCLPHLDFTVARALTKPSLMQSTFLTNAARPGVIKIRTQLDLWQMLRAATQPGSKLEFKYPGESVTVVLKASLPIRVTAPVMKVTQRNPREVHLVCTPEENDWQALEISMENASGTEPMLDVSWFTAEDSRPRALPLRRMLLPWATPDNGNEQTPKERNIPEIAGGNWLHGKRIFFGDQAACYKCHALDGTGGRAGPDLSNLIHRDYASVLKDIVEPNAAINPDHVAYNVELTNGEFVSGILVGSTSAESRFADATGKIITAPAGQVKALVPSRLSLMPEGLLATLTEHDRRSLLTFLLMPPPLSPAPLEISGQPPARRQSEVEGLLNGHKKGVAGAHSASGSPGPKSLNLVLCAGPKDHGPGEHDYPLWQKRWAKLLALAEKVSIETADIWPTAKQMEKADVIIFYSNNPGWSQSRGAELDTFLKRGGGLVYLHYAVDGHNHCEELARRIGLAWRGGLSKFRHGALNLKFESHAITEGLTHADFIDESYWDLVGDEGNIQLLASGTEGNRPRPLMWTREQGMGRVFVSIPGHYTWTFDDPVFRLLIFRGVAWAAQEPVDRFNELLTIGARLE